MHTQRHRHLPTRPRPRLVVRACRPPALTLLLAACLAGGCTSEQVYNSAQGWRQNECNKIADSERRERCLKEEANRPYGAYRGASSPGR